MIKLWKYTAYKSGYDGIEEEKTNFFRSRKSAEESIRKLFSRTYCVGVSEVEYAGCFTDENAQYLLDYGIYRADWHDWVNIYWSNCPATGSELTTPIDINIAKTDLDNIRQNAKGHDGFCGVPDGMTAEDYRDIWNDFVSSTSDCHHRSRSGLPCGY